jgi:hypothetical protein
VGGAGPTGGNACGGFLNIASPEVWTNYVAGFKQDLAQAGYVKGDNVAMARGQYDRLSAFCDRTGGSQGGGDSGQWRQQDLNAPG